MSPLMLIIVAPVVVIALVFVSLLLGAAATGVWEAGEERAHAARSAPGTARSLVAPQPEGYTRAA